MTIYVQYYIYNMSGRVVSDIQTRAEEARLKRLDENIHILQQFN
jgi:hypothetical protein